MGFLSNQKERAMKYEEDLEKKRQEFLSTRIKGIEKIVFDIVGAYPDEGSVRFVIDYDDSCFEFTLDGVEFSYYAKDRWVSFAGFFGEMVVIKKYCNCGYSNSSKFCYNPVDVLKEYKKEYICKRCINTVDVEVEDKSSIFDCISDWWKGIFG